MKLSHVFLSFLVAFAEIHCSAQSALSDNGVGSIAIEELYQYAGTSIYANNLQFLGVISLNNYATDSISNKYGTYGSNYSNTSIWNKYSNYGSTYNTLSAFCSYSTTPPIVFFGRRSRGLSYGKS